MQKIQMENKLNYRRYFLILTMLTCNIVNGSDISVWIISFNRMFYIQVSKESIKEISRVKKSKFSDEKCNDKLCEYVKNIDTTDLLNSFKFIDHRILIEFNCSDTVNKSIGINSNGLYMIDNKVYKKNLLLNCIINECLDSTYFPVETKLSK